MSKTFQGLALCILVSACGSSPKSGAQDPKPTTDEPSAVAPEPGAALADDPIAAEEKALAEAKPILEQYCGRCHGPKGKSSARKHFDMSSTPFGGGHAAHFGMLIPKVLGVGAKATMPLGSPGVVKGAELETVLRWAKAYQAAHDSGAGHHKHH